MALEVDLLGLRFGDFTVSVEFGVLVLGCDVSYCLNS